MSQRVTSGDQLTSWNNIAVNRYPRPGSAVERNPASIGNRPLLVGVNWSKGSHRALDWAGGAGSPDVATDPSPGDVSANLPKFTWLAQENTVSHPIEDYGLIGDTETAASFYRPIRNASSSRHAFAAGYCGIMDGTRSLMRSTITRPLEDEGRRFATNGRPHGNHGS